MTHSIFNEAAWTERLAAALEQVALASYSQPPPVIPGPRPIGEYWSALHCGIDCGMKRRMSPYP